MRHLGKKVHVQKWGGAKHIKVGPQTPDNPPDGWQMEPRHWPSFNSDAAVTRVGLGVPQNSRSAVAGHPRLLVAGDQPPAGRDAHSPLSVPGGTEQPEKATRGGCGGLQLEALHPPRITQLELQGLRAPTQGESRNQPTDRCTCWRGSVCRCVSLFNRPVRPTGEAALRAPCSWLVG